MKGEGEREKSMVNDDIFINYTEKKKHGRCTLAYDMRMKPCMGSVFMGPTHWKYCSIKVNK